MPKFREQPACSRKFFAEGTDVVWYFQDRCSSTRTPKFFTYLVLFIISLPSLRFIRSDTFFPDE